MKTEVEICEWNPKEARGALAVNDPGACQQEASVSLMAADGSWHLCVECAALPRFAKYKRRKQIKTFAGARI